MTGLGRMPGLAARALSLVAALGVTQSAADSASEAQLRMALAQPGAGGDEEALPDWAAAFQRAVQTCWQVDPSTAAGKLVVTVGFDLDPDGRVMAQSLSLLHASEGAKADVQSAYDSARRAVLRCQAVAGGGYDLPSEQYVRWKRVEMTFDPAPFRLR
ncbi:hypothetical protein [Maliponia aquimaris]|uniref:Gram-negative bacterial tonB protein n=1 Tax=Maliponia aquimaris TaxID=1673631 RepID=A0A238KBI4_9RHOB|nr:hypothetical protein [Maliponia aquimaris]SMX40210.1 hypothetical protein MAA8898_02074 [Maliponia aquimaris]